MEAKTIGFFEKYLTIWVALCIAAGIFLGHLTGSSMDILSRMELYNVFNRVTFGAPTRSILSANTLGTISTERNVSGYVNSGRLDGSSGRQGQLALRLVF